MSKIPFILSLSFLLSGCVGALVSGNTAYLGEDFPDIRTVPERPEATVTRGHHEGSETASRAAEFKKLEQDREKIKAREQALREKTSSS